METSIPVEPHAHLDLMDTGLPLLRGTAALLRALSFAQRHEVLRGPGVSDALGVLAHCVDEVRTLLERWEQQQGL
jgi:hypothetical protein